MAHVERSERGCAYRAKIKPRQACGCRIMPRPRQMSATGGIYDT